MHSVEIPFKLRLMYNVQFTLLKLNLDYWKHYSCWVYDLNAINIHKSLKFVIYSRPVVDIPFSLVALPTYVIDTFAWSIPKSLDLKF